MRMQQQIENSEDAEQRANTHGNAVPQQQELVGWEARKQQPIEGSEHEPSEDHERGHLCGGTDSEVVAAVQGERS